MMTMIKELNTVCVWVIYRMILTGETGAIGEKPATLPLCPFEILHGLPWDRTRVGTT